MAYTNIHFATGWNIKVLQPPDSVFSQLEAHSAFLNQGLHKHFISSKITQASAAETLAKLSNLCL